MWNVRDVSINKTLPSILGVLVMSKAEAATSEALLGMEGQMLDSRSSLGQRMQEEK